MWINICSYILQERLNRSLSLTKVAHFCVVKIVLLLLDLTTIECHDHLVSTVDGKILAEGKLVNLMNRELFAKFSSPIFTDTLKIYLAYALILAYSPNFSLPIAFTCTICQNFSPA